MTCVIDTLAVLRLTFRFQVLLLFRGLTAPRTTVRIEQRREGTCGETASPSTRIYLAALAQWRLAIGKWQSAVLLQGVAIDWWRSEVCTRSFPVLA